MSAIKLYTSKTDAFYFKDSQRNSFYEFGGIQLLPYHYYLQPYTYSDTITKVESFRLRDDLLLNDLSLYIQATVGYGIKFSQTNVMPYDYGNELIYLRFTYSGGYFYSNPFYYTTLDEDKTTYMAYRDNFVDALYYISLKVWFRQKSRQSELITYYETKTKNTVTQAIKSHDLDMYESEFMSMEDLIMTTDILESKTLYINNARCYLFEAVKLPELTQQENFGKIKFILNYSESTIITNGLILNLDAGNPLSYPGTGTLWTDLSGNNNNGTLVNNPTFDSANGGSIVFDGVDDYCDIPTSSVPTGNQVTISFWNKINVIKRSSIFSAYNSLGERQINIHLTWFDGRVYWDCGAIGATYDRIQSNVLTTQQRTGWHNWVFTKNAITGDMVMYLDGVSLASATGKTSTPSSISRCAIGNYDNVDYYSGNISTILFYNRALSSTEVLQNYNATKGRYGL